MMKSKIIICILCIVVIIETALLISFYSNKNNNTSNSIDKSEETVYPSVNPNNWIDQGDSETDVPDWYEVKDDTPMDESNQEDKEVKYVVEE